MNEMNQDLLSRPEQFGISRRDRPTQLHHGQQPAVVAHPHNAEEVAQAVRWAADRNLGVAVQASGHGAGAPIGPRPGAHRHLRPERSIDRHGRSHRPRRRRDDVVRAQLDGSAARFVRAGRVLTDRGHCRLHLRRRRWMADPPLRHGQLQPAGCRLCRRQRAAATSRRRCTRSGGPRGAVDVSWRRRSRHRHQAHTRTRCAPSAVGGLPIVGHYRAQTGHRGVVECNG